MKKFPVLMTAVAAAAFLAGCGGSSPGDQSPRLPFTRIVSFGDSLSDVGTYRTKLVADQGDGLYSINGDFSKEGLPYTNWTQYLASTLQVSQPCAAEIGLTPPQILVNAQDVNKLQSLAQAPAAQTGCFNYAEGGARVTNPIGPGNAMLYTAFNDASGLVGQLTYPLVTQVANFSAANQFSDTDLVTVLAGGNDLFMNRGGLDGAIKQIQATVPSDQQDDQIKLAAQAAIDAMTLAGTQLSALVKDQMIAAGATHVVVIDLPDVSLTPDAAIYKTTATGAVAESLHPNLVHDMVVAFNAALQNGLFGAGGDVTSNPNIVWVDAFGQSEAQAASPATYGLTNITTPACDLVTPKTGITVPNFGFVPVQSSLFCNKDTLIPPEAGVVTDTDKTGVMNFLYADGVHPTPFGYRLLAEYVGLQLSIKGWL